MSSFAAVYEGECVSGASVVCSQCTILTCILTCLGSVRCAGVDYDANNQQCWMHTEETVCGALRKYDGCTHHRKTSCSVATTKLPTTPPPTTPAVRTTTRIVPTTTRAPTTRPTTPVMTTRPPTTTTKAAPTTTKQSTTAFSTKLTPPTTRQPATTPAATQSPTTTKLPTTPAATTRIPTTPAPTTTRVTTQVPTTRPTPATTTTTVAPTQAPTTPPTTIKTATPSVATTRLVTTPATPSPTELVPTTPTQAPTTPSTTTTTSSTTTPATTQTSTTTTITPPGLPNNGNFFPRHPDKVPTFIPTGWAAYPGRQIEGSFTLIENVADGDTCFNACVTNLQGTCYAVDYDNAYSQCWMFITDGTDIGEACHPLKANPNIYHIKRNACPDPYESPFVYGA
ncbi:hypothetical protein CAPTEDRAFT_199340 [Capitella teleta]|uniref:Apple domain-containing protein n=1 Tax=Capitella teleta TaxID=283909 RepID=R7U0U6_CAPTE|nr:hypothetical protein CAPTEDRAFT_199340 [Capitella teleta]|eukprot:ELT97281.1 hypothetical protein CAPTEDRAFT_199340 [Capitella teleta]